MCVMKLIIQICCLNEARTLPETLGDLPRSVPGFDADPDLDADLDAIAAALAALEGDALAQRPNAVAASLLYASFREVLTPVDP